MEGLCREPMGKKPKKPTRQELLDLLESTAPVSTSRDLSEVERAVLVALFDIAASLRLIVNDTGAEE